MRHIFDGYNHLVRLERGELLVESLTRLAREQHIKAAWIHGLGGAQWAELGFYDLPTRQYQWKKFDQLLEITSFQGNIAWKENAPILHIHGTFGAQDYTAIAGHVKELMIAGTCELHIHTIFGDTLQRTHDTDTGLSLLAL